jgi:hypothetical protein
MITLDSVTIVILALLIGACLSEGRVGLTLLLLLGMAAWKLALWRTLTQVRAGRPVTPEALLEKLKDFTAEQERATRWLPAEEHSNTSTLQMVSPGDQLDG